MHSQPQNNNYSCFDVKVELNLFAYFKPILQLSTVFSHYLSELLLKYFNAV